MTITLVQTRIGTPQLIGLRPRTDDVWYSSIHRQPVNGGLIYVTPTGLAGDQPSQTDAKKEGGQVHGGHRKAVYVLPERHLAKWRELLGDSVMNVRSLGENLRVRGDIDESKVRIGDRWTIGNVILVVSTVRTPCATLECYYGGHKMIKAMRDNGLCGWYMSIVQTGLMPTSGPIHVDPASSGQTVRELFAEKMKLKA